jgi:flagellum-specific ATP synthase
VLQSISRTMSMTVPSGQMAWAAKVRGLMATWTENEELVRLGAYKRGTDPEVDAAIEAHPHIQAFLRQQVGEKTDLPDCQRLLARLAGVNAELGNAPVTPPGRPAAPRRPAPPPRRA